MRVIVYQASDTSALSKNFTREEFKCPCGCTRQMVDSELVEKMQAVREKLGKPIKISSGYRCIPHNAAVKGSSGSKHRYGMAADWRMKDRNINPVALGIIATQYFKAVGIYWYDGCAIVHTDTRDTKATWLCDAPKHYPSTTYNTFILPTIRRGSVGDVNRTEDAPAVAGADPGRHFWRKNRKRPAESAGEAQAGRGWHLRPCQLAGNFWGQQVSVT